MGSQPQGTTDATETSPSDGVDGFLHWQVVVAFANKVRLAGVRAIFGPYHAEPTKSAAADAYVWKDNTRVDGTQFEIGRKPRSGLRDNQDWTAIRDLAKAGRLDDIPPDVYVRNYNAIKRISVDHLQPVGVERTVEVYWGPTGVGKSRRVWQLAGFEAYPKDPRTKFWDGYRGQKHVVIDEFRGSIDISHLLRWFDRYPVIVEVKGSSVVLAATHIFVTSNIPPEAWYPDLDVPTMNALKRRLKITHVEYPLYDDINE